MEQHSTANSLKPLLERLRIPPDYARTEFVSTNPLPELEAWSRTASDVLQQISVLLKARRDGADRGSRPDSFGVEVQADVLFAVAPFGSLAFLKSRSEQDGSEGHGREKSESSVEEEGEDAPKDRDLWVTSSAETAAQDILGSTPELVQPTHALVSHILSEKLRPIFRTNPHPHVNETTGRKINQAAGGKMAMQDYYDAQQWKEYPGIAKVLLWCVRHIDTDAYENVWHLVIPPLMALLDDYEAANKLQGVFVVQEMLLHVPRDLLKRTGIGALFKQSLRTCLSHLQNPETSELLKNAIDASVSLILLITSLASARPSSERFDELSSLLGEGIIAGIWLYAEDKPDVVQATFDALPRLLTVLDIGSTRFLKPLIPQLMHTLIPQPLLKPDRRLQLSAIRVVDTLIDLCKPRLSAWKETLLDGIARCWVNCIDEENGKVTYATLVTSEDSTLRKEVKHRLVAISGKISLALPTVREVEYPLFLRADRELFKGIFGSVA